MKRDVINLLALWVSLCAVLLIGAHRREQREAREAQEAQNLGRRYALVSPDDPEVLVALDARNLAGARGRVRNLPGARLRMPRESSFTGTVSALYAPTDGSVRLLNFHPDYRQAIVAAIKPADYARLGDLGPLVGRRVLVRGRFFLFNGRPEVELASPAQIKLVQ